MSHREDSQGRDEDVLLPPPEDDPGEFVDAGTLGLSSEDYAILIQSQSIQDQQRQQQRHPGGGADASSSGGGGVDGNEETRKTAFEEYYAKKYRDRAEERRKGDEGSDQHDDFEMLERLEESVRREAASTGNEVEEGKIKKAIAERSQYLGGDVEHTHLVRGLDRTLLQRVRTQIAKVNDYEDDDGYDDDLERGGGGGGADYMVFDGEIGKDIGGGGGSGDLSVVRDGESVLEDIAAEHNVVTSMGKRVMKLLDDHATVNQTEHHVEHLRYGRTAFAFDLRPACLGEIPIVSMQSVLEENIHGIDHPGSVSMPPPPPFDAEFIHEIRKLMRWSRRGGVRYVQKMRRKERKLEKKKEYERMKAMASEKGDEKTETVLDIFASEDSGKNVGDFDDDIFPGAGKMDIQLVRGESGIKSSSKQREGHYQTATSKDGLYEDVSMNGFFEGGENEVEDGVEESMVDVSSAQPLTAQRVLPGQLTTQASDDAYMECFPMSFEGDYSTIEERKQTDRLAWDDGGDRKRSEISTMREKEDAFKKKKEMWKKRRFEQKFQKMSKIMETKLSSKSSDGGDHDTEKGGNEDGGNEDFMFPQPSSKRRKQA